MKKEYQKYWLCGIIGAVCFGIGDWLLGYVDPGIVNESFSVIKASSRSHCCSVRLGYRSSCWAV